MSTSIPAVELHTPRLLLRPLQLSDAQQTQLLFPHWEIVKHLNAIVPWPYPADGVSASNAISGEGDGLDVG